MKIALAQMDVIPGRPKKNIETMLKMITEARKKGVDLIAFPEMCIGGYLLGDKWCDESFCENLMQYNEKIREASKGIAIAYGNIFIDKEINERVGDKSYHPNKDGRLRKYNAVYIFQDGKPARRAKETKYLPNGIQPKTLLPTYRIFDDERYFFSTQDVAKDFSVKLEDLISPFIISIKGRNIKVGFELCEDLWCEDYRRDGNSLNITKVLARSGAEKVVNISASPWTYGKNKAKDRRINFIREDIGDEFIPYYYVNCVGAQNNGKNILTFDGGSTVYNSEGLPVLFSKKAYEEELIIIEDSDLERKVLERKEEPKVAQKYQAIVRGIQHFKDIGNGEIPRFVIGLSGGIDSSVVAALLVKAVGNNRVLGINMPSNFNKEITKECAKRVAESLDIGYEVIPIEDLIKLNEEIIEKYDLDGSGRTLNAVQKGNIAAKIRGSSILSNVAGKYGSLFTNNGNKWEVSVGYATLYGDINGALCPIADLAKAEVFDLARYLNDVVYKKEIIPKELIPDELYRFDKNQIEPSAELEHNQVDPIKTGYHDALLMEITDYKKKSAEDIMRFYIDGILDEVIERNLDKEKGYGVKLIKRWGIDSPKTFVEDLEWLIKGINWAIFKRIQTGPIIITSKSSFGYDIRESFLPYESTIKQEELKRHILEKMDKYKSRRRNDL